MPSFTVKEFQNTEEFLDRIPSGYDYAVEFRLSSWNTEGPRKLGNAYFWIKNKKSKSYPLEGEICQKDQLGQTEMAR